MRVNNKLNRISDFYCTFCGHKGFPIIRKAGQEREPGHLKKLFCIYCNQERNMVEIKQGGKYNLEIFELEFHNGNFVNGERVKPYKQFLADYYQEIEERRGGGYHGDE